MERLTQKSDQETPLGDENVHDLLDIMVDALDEKVCWECGPEDNWPEEIAETA
jgi:hypothetical protein